MNLSNDDDSCSSVDSDVAFAYMDFTGVNFDEEGATADDKELEVSPDKKANTPPAVVEKATEENDISISKPVKNNTVMANQALEDGVKNLMGGQEGKSDATGVHVPNTKLSAEMETITIPLIHASPSVLDEESKLAIDEERRILLKDCYWKDDDMTKNEEPSSTSGYDSVDNIREIAKQLSQGHYMDILCGRVAQELFSNDNGIGSNGETDTSMTVVQRIRHCVLEYCTSVAKCVEVELVAVAALNLFMQPNYTGPSLHHGGVSRPGKEEETYEALKTVNPHPLFSSQLKVSSSETKIDTKEGEKETEDQQHEPPIDVPFHNAVLAELSIDGEWPCPVCKYPYFLLLARSILSTLALPNRPDWTQNIVNESGEKETVVRKSNSGNFFESPSQAFIACAQNLFCAPIWCGRAIVAHCRLLQGDEPSMTLWKEAKNVFDNCITKYCESVNKTSSAKEERILASKVMLEYGLAEHHFDREKKGKPYFRKALAFADLDVEVTGSEGKRTKYQEKATAQMLVRAKPTDSAVANEEEKTDEQKKIEGQEIKLAEDSILLDRVKYTTEDDNVHFELNIHQQTILLALCLDVKNDNPMDGLTGEQMGAFLERVLQQHDDWMVYATGLLERAWLESEKNHTRERALLQLQALADQHTNRLTFTQSTFQAAVEDSAPPPERLRNIHYIVYPPRWGVLRDLAERYAKIGIVTSAAEIFEEIELWDDVVECYRRAGKMKKAEEVVRKRLEESETPRMWAALGDITEDKSYYEKALEVSYGKYSAAHVALGKYYTDKGDIAKAVEQFKKAVHIKPLTPHVWFRLGALSMRLEDWETALQAFTEVVKQEPEEGDAWANVAAIHMHNRNPDEAYPALNESLKLNRNNWRVWVSKLYTCMDLQKYDEAIQACLFLVDFKAKKNESENIPAMEEKVIRALVGASVKKFDKAAKAGDTPAIDAAKRTLGRVRDLLSRLKSAMKDPWLFEVCAYFNECVGRSDQAVDDLMKEYRSLVSYKGWEFDQHMLDRICRVIRQLSEIHLEENDVEGLKKLKFLVKGIIRKTKAAYFDPAKLPTTHLDEMDSILNEIESKTI